MKETRQDLLAEIDELRVRLQEAEETLEALRTGAVDALVVATSGGEQVYTLQGVDTTYRHLVENINEGAATLSTAGDILYANARLAEILGEPLERLIGSALREHISDTDRIYFEALLATAARGDSRGEVLLKNGDEQGLPAYLSFKILEIDEATPVLSLLVTDLREQKRQESIIAEGRLIQEILQQSEQAIILLDQSGKIIRASRGVQALCGQNPLLLPFYLVFPLKQPGTSPGSEKTFLLTPLLEGQTLRNVEVSFQRADGKKVHVLLNAGPLRWPSGEIVGFVAILTDVSSQRQAEAEKEELLGQQRRNWQELRQQQQVLQSLNEQLQEANEELAAGLKQKAQQAERLQEANRQILAAHAALRESREDLQRAQQIAHLGDWRLDARHDRLTWGEGTYRIFGVTPGTPVSYETFMAAVHPEDRSYVQHRWHAAQEGEPYDIEHRIVVGDTVKWVRELADLELDHQDQVLGAFGTVQDITVRKEAEAALRLSVQRLDLLAETASRLLASSDFREVVESTCQKMCELLDCDVFCNFLREEPGERLHLNAWSGISEQEAQQLDRLGNTPVCGCPASDGGHLVAEDITANPDPSLEIVKSYGLQAYACQPLSIGGRIVGTIAFGTRKRKHFKEDELALLQAVADQVAVALERQEFETAMFEGRERERNRAEELQAILDAVPIPIFVSRDSSGQCITGNLAAYTLLQMPAGSNVSRAAPEGTYKAMQDGRELDLAELPMQRALRGEWVRDLEYDLVRADGSSRHVLANAVPLLDDSGQPRGAVGGILDLTELKEAQEALRQAHADLEVRVQERTEVLRITVNQLQEEIEVRRRAEAELIKQTELVEDLYNRAPCGYHSLDREGWIIRMNDTELDWLGYKKEELLKRVHFEDLLAEESQPAFRESFRELLRTGLVRDREYILRRKDGTEFPVLLNATVVHDESGNFLMTRSTVYDITERKQAEQHLRESEERLRVLASQLLTAQEQERKRLAGELHDELGHALLTLKLSLGAIGRQLLPGQEAVHDLLREQTEYIGHVIEEVRRLYHDLSPGDLEDVGLSRALRNLIEDFGSHQPDISCAVDLPDLTGKFSLPTQTIMYRLVQEALTNIGKHAEPTRVNIWAVEENGYVRLNIEDDGRGFDVSEVEQDPDRGMGLAAMQERLYIVSGSMRVWSQKGTGTKLTFMVPMTEGV
jgi:PAS domain S-box-containing protein